jgi:hypothetical protein
MFEMILFVLLAPLPIVLLFADRRREEEAHRAVLAEVDRSVRLANALRAVLADPSSISAQRFAVETLADVER